MGTSPLMARLRGGCSRKAHEDRILILKPGCWARIASRNPCDRNLSMRVLNRWAIAKEHEELELPVRLNPEKGSEGPCARDYNMNSSRPLISLVSGDLACYNKALTYEEDFVTITHPDRTMQVPEHSALRLASLATLSPDPYTYSLLSLLFQGVVSDYDVDLDRIPVSLEQTEANGSLYQLNEAGASSMVVELGDDQVLRLRFPSYFDVLKLHGLNKEGLLWWKKSKVYTAVEKVRTDIGESYLSEGEPTLSKHNGYDHYDLPVKWDLRGDIYPTGSSSAVHFTHQSGPVQFGH